MNELVIVNDYKKVFIYCFINFLLTILIMFGIMWFYVHSQFLIAFLLITAIWFSVKYMCHYAMCFIKHRPVIIFRKNEIVCPNKEKVEQIIKYKDIQEVRIMRDWKSIKLFFKSNKTSHPSGYMYVGISYLFKRSDLNRVMDEIEKCLEKHNLKINKISKGVYTCKK